MTSGVNGAALTTLRRQGLDVDGNPVSSYWKARIEAEERRVRVHELEAEIEYLCNLVEDVRAEKEAENGKS